MEFSKRDREIFIPYRCEDCIHGKYNHNDSCWENGCTAEDDEECRREFRKNE